MKKNIKFLAIAAVASLIFVACNNNSTETTDTLDTTAIEQAVVEEMPVEVLDTTPVVAEETPVQTAKKAVKTTAKKAVKEEVKTVQEEVKTATKDQVNTGVTSTGKTSMKPKL